LGCLQVAKILAGLNPSVVIRSFWGENNLIRGRLILRSQSLRGDQVFLGLRFPVVLACGRRQSQSLRGDQVFLGAWEARDYCHWRKFGLNPSVVIRSFWGYGLGVLHIVGICGLNPSVVIRSFWGKGDLIVTPKFVRGLNPSVVIRSFWGRQDGSVVWQIIRLNPSVVIRSFWGPPPGRQV